MLCILCRSLAIIVLIYFFICPFFEEWYTVDLKCFSPEKKHSVSKNIKTILFLLPASMGIGKANSVNQLSIMPEMVISDGYTAFVMIK